MTGHAEKMADVRDMYMAHAVFRREFRLMPGLIRAVAERDTLRAETVAAHVDLLCRILHAHHEGEDLILWPRLQERAGTEAATWVPTMRMQHGTLDRTLEEVSGLLPSWRATARDGEELGGVLDQLLVSLSEHMAMEEHAILPLAEKYVTAAEWNGLGRHGMAAFSRSELILSFGLVMYEGDPEVIAGVLQEVPPPARFLIPRIAPLLFAKHARRVHGTPEPPRSDAPLPQS